MCILARVRQLTLRAPSHSLARLSADCVGLELVTPAFGVHQINIK